MRILIDADGCPVVEIAIRIAKENGIPCILICDTSHIFDKYEVATITVSKGADSVDLALANMAEKGDIVITQDYGLAALCLARGAVPVSQDGMVYNNSNIDGLLMQRHTAKKIRMGGGKLRGNSKRKPEQDLKFEKVFNDMLN